MVSVSSHTLMGQGKGHPIAPQTARLSCMSKLPLPPGQFCLYTVIATYPSHQTQEQHSVTAKRLESENRMLEAASPLSKNKLADLGKF